MIIFDTNAVNLLSPDGARADIIRKLRQSGHHRVAVPWMVLEEMAAHKAHLYPVKHQAVLNTLEKLRDILPWEPESSLEPLDLERFLDHWRKVYGEIFEVIETSNGVIRRAFQREAMAQLPAKRGKDHSEGGRDAAIWFSVLEFLEQNPDQHVHFVTNNSKDFSDGTSYPYPLNEDIRGLEHRLTLLQDFDQVVSQFTEAVSGKDAEAAALELLKSPSVREGVAQAAAGLSTLTGFAGLGDGTAVEQWYAWCEEPEIELLSVTDVTGHRIEDDVWYTAKARWLLYGLAVDEMESLSGHIACVWETKVLFSTRNDETPTLLALDEPSPPDTGDESCMEILRGLKKRVAGIAAGAKRSLLAVQTPPAGLGTDQLPPLLAKLDLASLRLAQDAARAAALMNGPAQRLARQIAANQKLIDGPGLRFARQMAAHSAALQAAANSPGLRLAQQAAASMAKLDIAASIPQIGVPVVTQPTSGGAAVAEDGDEELEVSDAQAERDETADEGDGTAE
ncbi:PIN domain-containing protein [Streptomyces sp. NPDC093109]|uniref:PIN domain-containing protein n=1 Tax=Streptomyces sp. NPDC093109 TaxID=3154977 RepID=UPI0034504654